MRNASPSHGGYEYEDPDSHNQLGDDEDPEILKNKFKEGPNKVYHDFFKTKMCNLYLLNICKKGKECAFAHSEDELREKPNLFRTKLCPNFLEGHCSRGDNCAFAHGETNLRSTPDLFKTAICNLWAQGKCNTGERCRFAHGYEDLRPAPSHHKFKKNNYNKAFNGNQQNNRRNSNQHRGGHDRHGHGHGHGHRHGNDYNHHGGHNSNHGNSHGHSQMYSQGQNQPHSPFYSQPTFPPQQFAYPMYPMQGMQPGFQNMGFMSYGMGQPYLDSQNSYKDDSF